MMLDDSCHARRKPLLDSRHNPTGRLGFLSASSVLGFRYEITPQMKKPKGRIGFSTPFWRAHEAKPVAGRGGLRRVLPLLVGLGSMPEAGTPLCLYV